MSIKVTNKTKQPIHVSINYWEGSANTGWFKLKENGGSDTWGRQDMRGFVMAVNIDGTQFPYFVQSDSDIVVYADKVTDHGQTIGPVNRNKEPMKVDVAVG